MSDYLESRVSLTLSQYAEQVIQADMAAYDLKRNSLINKIIKNYKTTSNASIIISLDRKRNSIEAALQEHAKNNPINTELINILTNKYESDLVKKMNGYNKDSGTTKKIRLINDNSDLIDMKNRYFSFTHYKTLSDYIKALIEEYSQLSVIDREAIIFKEMYQKAMESKGKSATVYTSNEVFQTQIYDIRPDERYNYNYIITYDPAKTKTRSLRLSRILNIEPNENNTRKTISDKTIEEQITKMGIPYLSGESTFIRIELTSQGHKLYTSIMHLRPKYTKKTDNDNGGCTLEFDCSERQVQNYFFKFGKEAKILFPISLAKEFEKAYLEAFKHYKDN